MQVLVLAQTAHVSHRQEQARASILTRRRNTQKAEPQLGEDGSESQKSGSYPAPSGDTRVEVATIDDSAGAGPSLAVLLAESLARIGRERWNRLRSRPHGRLSYHRIQVC